jgi:3-phenylpropionate/cinnamic acid dioxygenase small subunit
MTLDAADRAAITDLVHRYAAYIDDRQFGLAAELFAEDAELTLPDPPATLEPIHQHRGRAAIRDALADVAATIRTQHAIVGEVYDDHPRTGTARGRIACVAHHWILHKDQIRDVVWHLRYDDEYQRNDADWRIARRVLTIDAIDVRSARQVRREL